MALQNNSNRKPKSMGAEAKEEALEAGSQEPIKAPEAEFNIPTGIPADSPTARQRIEDLERSRGGFSFLAQAAIRGAAAGAKAGQGANTPLGSFLQGVNVGIDVPQQLYNEKRSQLQSTIDASPLFVTMPELANTPGYEALKNMPTAIAIKTMQTIAADTIKLKQQEESSKRVQQAQISAQEAAGSISDMTEATSYANMFNTAYGLKGKEAISPNEIMGMRKEDVDNFFKIRGGAGAGDMGQTINTSVDIEKAEPGLLNTYITAPQRKNPYYKLPQKVAAKVREFDVKKSETVVSKMMEEANSMAANANELRVAKSLITPDENGNVALNTGPMIDLVRISKLRGPEAQNFARIVEKTVPLMRQGMPGAASDRDVSMFRGATIGLDKDEAVNAKIIDQALAVAARIEDKAKFMANFKNVYGDINGAEAEYQKFVNNNNLFNADGSVNSKAVTSDAYFNSQSSERPLSDSERARLQELRAKAGK